MRRKKSMKIKDDNDNNNDNHNVDYQGAGENTGSVELPAPDMEFTAVYFLLEFSSSLSLHLLNFPCVRYYLEFNPGTI